MHALVPQHRHFIAGHLDRCVHHTQRRHVAHQPLGQHRDEIGACDRRHHEQEVRHGQHDAPHGTDLRERFVRHAEEAAAIGRHDHVFERAELRERGAPLQLRMPGAADEHITLDEQRQAPHAGRRPFCRMKGEVDAVSFGILLDARRREFDDGEPRTGRGRAQRVQRGQHDRRLAVVGRGHAPRVRRGRRIERGGRNHRALDGFERIAQRLAQRFRARGRPHPARPRQQQRVAEQVAQFLQLHAHRRLRHVQLLGRTRDVVLGEQHVQRDEQVQVESSEIIHGYTWNIRNSFQIYLWRRHPVVVQSKE